MQTPHRLSIHTHDLSRRPALITRANRGFRRCRLTIPPPATCLSFIERGHHNTGFGLSDSPCHFVNIVDFYGTVKLVSSALKPIKVRVFQGVNHEHGRTKAIADRPISDLTTVKKKLDDILPLIEANAELAETQRQPVDAVISALEETGIFRAFVPKRYGGLEIDLNSFIDLGLAVSECCTSTGWVTTFYMEHNWILAQFKRATQEAIFSRQPYVLALASISPNGQAHRVENSYRLSGRWAWGTGVMHADWVMLNGVVAGDKPEPRLFIAPRSSIEVQDVWHTSGMRGTGSNDMLANELVVSDTFSEPLKGMAVGRGSGVNERDHTYRYPMMPLLAIAAAIPALGGAKRALREFENDSRPESSMDRERVRSSEPRRT